LAMARWSQYVGFPKERLQVAAPDGKTYQQVPDVQPTPSNVEGFKAQNVKPFGAQAIVPSKSMHVSSTPQMTPDGHVCCTQRKPLGHEGSCDIARPTTASWFGLSPKAYLGLLRR
jgi:hypothetical protein